MAIDEQLRKAIGGYGSIYAVARDTGVAWSTLQRFMTGERDMYLATASNLCRFFGMTLTEPKRAKATRPGRARTKRG